MLYREKRYLRGEGGKDKMYEGQNEKMKTEKKMKKKTNGD